ncbi:MAG: serine hydrolase [Gemmatimonadota bacterium]|nr:MAG: serine hydrolase [Gemmatimonadota bacterium]
MFKKILILIGIIGGMGMALVADEIEIQVPQNGQTMNIPSLEERVNQRRLLQTEGPSDMYSIEFNKPMTHLNSTELDSFIVATMDEYHIPGLGACVVKDGQIIWTGGYGYANIEGNVEVADTTVFYQASISKTITGTALMQLWEDSLFGLDDDIDDYLPFEVNHPLYPDDPITFRMLLTHTSAIKDNYWGAMAPVIVQGDSPIPLGEYLEDYFVPGGTYYDPDENFQSWRPGSVHIYSNLGICLAGYLVEAITGIPFDEYCRDSIFIPLGMNETAWFLADLDTNNIAMPYTYIEQSDKYIPYGYYGLPWYPSTMLMTSAPQLGRFLAAYMQWGELDGQRILDSTTVELMITPQISWVGLTWFRGYLTTEHHSNVLVWGHEGSYIGVRTIMYYAPVEKIGVLVLANLETESGLWPIFDKLFDFAAPVDPNIALSATSYDYGDVPIGSSIDWVFAISNDGAADLVITQITSDHSDFVITSPVFPRTVPPGGEISVMVTYTPSNVGTMEGQLSIISNDPDEPIVIVALQGEGVKPPDISVSPDSLSEDLFKGNTTTQTLTISNTGRSDLTFDIWTEGQNQQYALEFDGINDYVGISNGGGIAGLDEGTIALWVKWIGKQDHGSPGYGVVLGRQKDYVFTNQVITLSSDDPNSAMVMWYPYTAFDVAITSSTPVGNELWRYIVITYSSGNHKLYIDGELDGTSDMYGSVNSDIGVPLTIGAGIDDIGSYSRSHIDEVAIWNIVRTQPEIQADMHREISAGELGLVGYWRFNEGSGITVFDQTPNGNNGVLHGGVTWVISSAPITATWLSLAPTSGIVPVDSLMDIEVTFDATGLDGGDYYACVVVSSNDPDEPEVIIHLHLRVEASRVIVSVPTIGSLPGDTAQVSLDMDNLTWLATSIGSFETELGFDNSLLELVGIVPGERVQHLGIFEWSLLDPGMAAISIYDTTENVIEPGSGAVVEMSFVVNAAATFGANATITIVNATLTDESGDTLAVESLNGMISVGLKGDVNADGQINIVDALIAVNILLEIMVPTDYEGWAADCNGDGQANVLDVVGIVNVILGLGECVPGICKSELTPEAMEFMKLLEPYFSAADFTEFMALVKAEVEAPAEYSLVQNYPNPFNAHTDIRYQIADVTSPVYTTLKIYNILGQEVRTVVDEVKESGYHSVTWDGEDQFGNGVASGVYFYQLKVGDLTATKCMVLMK